jgi:hypothetical protein
MTKEEGWLLLAVVAYFGTRVLPMIWRAWTSSHERRRE